jgi:hypothetical protein
MPIPSPEKNEDPQEYLSRCIEAELPHVQEKHSDKSSEKQRSIAAAICVSKWEKTTGRKFPSKKRS